MTNFPPHHDLSWMAFLYVAGEASADQRREFESLLETSDAAREALVEAVALSQGLHATYSVAASDSSHVEQQHVAVAISSTAHSPEQRVEWVGKEQRSTRSSFWWSVGIAVCLLVLMQITLVRPRLVSSSSESALAEAWSAGVTSATASNPWRNDLDPALDEAPAIEVQTGDPMTADPLATDDAAPSWMMEALLLGDAASGEASDVEEMES